MTRYAKIKEKLEGRLEILGKRTAKVENSLRRERDHDSQERAAEAENDEVLERLDQGGLDEITAIETALAQIEDGTYGVCESCGERIALGRLGALPFAAACIDCAS